MLPDGVTVFVLVTVPLGADPRIWVAVVATPERADVPLSGVIAVISGLAGILELELVPCPESISVLNRFVMELVPPELDTVGDVVPEVLYSGAVYPNPDE